MSFSQINTELSQTSTGVISLNNTNVRSLAGVGANPAQIAITDLSGKSSTIPFSGFNTISTFNGSTSSSYWYGAASNTSGRLVAVGYTFNGSTNSLPLFSTSTDGITWTTPAVMGGVSSGFYQMFDVVCNASGLFVAVGYQTNGLGNAPVTAVYAKSSNGTSWTAPAQMGASASTNFIMRGVAANTSGNFVATGFDNSSNRPTFSYSADGSSWTQPNYINGFASFSPMRRVYCNPGNNLFVTTGRGLGGLPAIAYSYDGTTWSSPTNIGSINSDFQNITCNASGRWVAVGSTQFGGSNGIAMAATSTDGINWTTAYVNTSSDYCDLWSVVADKNGKFIAAGNSTYPTNQSKYATSTDGTTWTTLAAISPGGVNNNYIWDSCIQP
jgi:multimeric flavodoxin WrbA